MIHVELDEQTVARTRIAISPLWETVCSLHLLARSPGTVPWPYTAWARHARTVLSTVDAVQPVRILLGDCGRSSPDFFSPVPPSATPSLEEELAALVAVDSDTIDAQVAKHYGDDVPDAIAEFRDRPGPALRRFADGIAAYWDAAIADRWPAMRSSLDEEVLLRARALAADGPDALLSDLHERVRWQPPVLTLVKPKDFRITAQNMRLVLIPLIFSQGALMCSTDDPAVVAVSYQARGATALADGPASVSPGADRLTVLLGRGRAAVLNGLAEPSTTAGLATRLGLAPSTVSEHLAGLLAAGVVHRRRIGRHVLYELEPAGVALVSLLR
ncbi:ArsR/SmtB family transcription factor [Rugosimonospora africana]|uniref:Transcriptional regulator n=1 Tax=Rugosimonospora africana TaxID=556532 RepID=A0A8J3QW65_9ACTN|nr:winged helix-turn-helix domain-containing protein [Rugosimonospora africana]GIH15861.1 transcriptional regulator [Rugosimonospora africana]